MEKYRQKKGYLVKNSSNKIHQYMTEVLSIDATTKQEVGQIVGVIV